MTNRLQTPNGVPDPAGFGGDSASVVAIAHDLKAHLAGTLMLAEQVALESAVPGNRMDSLAQRVLADGGRMLRILDHLLETSRGGVPGFPLQRSVCNLSRLLRQAVKSNWDHALAKDIRLRCPDLGTGECWGRMDEEGLRTAVDGLVNNVIKFSPPGTEIQVSLVPHERAGELFALIQVKSQRPGLKPGDQATAFGSFQNLSTGPTTGEHSTRLGLSSVRQVVEQHGGKVWIENASSQTATFCIDLPMTMIA